LNIMQTSLINVIYPLVVWKKVMANQSTVLTSACFREKQNQDDIISHIFDEVRTIDVDNRTKHREPGKQPKNLGRLEEDGEPDGRFERAVDGVVLARGVVVGNRRDDVVRHLVQHHDGDGKMRKCGDKARGNDRAEVVLGAHGGQS